MRYRGLLSLPYVILSSYGTLEVYLLELLCKDLSPP